jgi:hypothetical protein
MLKTFKELQEIDSIHGRLLKNPSFKQTKLAYAFKRFTQKNLVKIFTDFNNSNQDIRIDNALVDEKTKALLYKEDGENFQFSKEGLKAVMKQLRENKETWDIKEFEIEPFICKEPLDESLKLEENEVELLKGVII